MTEAANGQAVIGRNLRITQWIFTGVMLALAYWAKEQSLMFMWMSASLGILTIISVFEMVRPSQNWIFGLLLTQVAVLGISPVAVSGFPSVMFNILGARASAVEERKRFVIVLVALSIASVMSMLILQHINVRPLLNVPRGLNSQVGNLVRELYKIAMIWVCGLFVRNMINEQKARQVAEKLTREIEDLTVELERKRIAQDVHDNLGHILAPLRMELELTTELLEQKKVSELSEALNAVSQLAADSCDELRRAIRAIRDDFDLTEAVVSLAQEFADKQKIELDLDIDKVQLPIFARHELFSIVRESLTNIQKHAKASKLKIRLKELGGQLVLNIEDNGIGVRVDRASNGFGLKGMKERAGRLGASLKVESVGPHGTMVELTVPNIGEA